MKDSNPPEDSEVKEPGCGYEVETFSDKENVSRREDPLGAGDFCDFD